MKHNYGTLTALALAVALLMPTTALAMNTATGSADVERRRSERLVREEFKAKEALNRVQVSVEDGIATLTGEVDLLVHKTDAEKRAKRVDRIAGVRNQIRVKPATDIGDEKLFDTLSTKLAYDDAGFGNIWNTLSLKVEKGVATVSGKVRDYPARESALAIVQSTRGVTGLVDNIEVAATSGFDDDLRLRVARAVYGHSALQKYALDPQKPIRIVVDGGRVELHGVVGSSFDRQVAVTQARSVGGAFAVEDKLVVASANR